MATYLRGPREIVPKCFDQRELAYLDLQTDFQKALLELQCFDDVETVVTLGQSLLDERDAIVVLAQFRPSTARLTL